MAERGHRRRHLVNAEERPPLCDGIEQHSTEAPEFGVLLREPSPVRQHRNQPVSFVLGSAVLVTVSV